MTRRRLQQAESILLASHNAGKLVELGELLHPFGIECISAGELQIPEPEETGSTFLENATIKAQAVAQQGGRPALSDDSGLVVDALDGAPGIFSARWAGPNKDFRAAMQKVLDKLSHLQSDNRNARFVCTLVLAWPDGHCEAFEGSVEGDIIDAPRGDKGFGYDPIFRPHGHKQSFAEMEPAQKQSLSHRARAFDALSHGCLSKPARS